MLIPLFTSPLRLRALIVKGGGNDGMNVYQVLPTQPPWML